VLLPPAPGAPAGSPASGLLVALQTSPSEAVVEVRAGGPPPLAPAGGAAASFVVRGAPGVR
jgi:hypothetical protein